VLDVSGVTLLAAAGLHVLLDLQKRLDPAGARLVLACPTTGGRHVLSATGLDQTLLTACSLTDAVERVASPGR
jgi:anti-anti-sigma regulatory factor